MRSLLHLPQELHMDVLVLSHQPLQSEHRIWIESRVRRVTRRLVGVMRRATVRLEDLNGPKGGVDQICRIHLSTDQGEVVVTHRAASWQGSVHRALSRAVMALKQRVASRRPRRSAS